MLPRRKTALVFAAAILAAVGIAACKKEEPPPSPILAALPPMQDAPPYPISERGGTPATGPGARYNNCERIWCVEHGENYFIDHFLWGHVGYVVHDPKLGDVYVQRFRKGGPDLSKVRHSALLLCGFHVHPWVFGKSGGTPIRHTGWNNTLGYTRAHFRAYGTRLDTCCINGLGSGFVHSDLGRQYRFHDLDEFRKHPEIGWQKPFAARVVEAKVDR